MHLPRYLVEQIDIPVRCSAAKENGLTVVFDVKNPDSLAVAFCPAGITLPPHLMPSTDTRPDTVVERSARGLVQ